MFDSDFAEALLEGMGSHLAMVVLDSTGTCVFANSKTFSTIGKNHSELLGKNFVDNVQLASLDGTKISTEHNPVTKALVEKDYHQTTPFFCRLSMDDNAINSETLALTAIPIHKDAKTNFVVIQIRKAKREVDVGEMKSLFVSFAAHQLKTPSSVVKGFLELMLKQGESAYSKDQWHFLTSAFESNENLITVSKTLLNMARLEGGLIEPVIRHFDPMKILKQKIDSFEPIYDVKKQTVRLSELSVDSGLDLNSDESFFAEIFGILLGNAIKHSPNESEIVVTCSVTPEHCTVHVINFGLEMAQVTRDKLFEKKHDSSADGNSHGLGLYMAKKYIALLGGTIGLSEFDSKIKNTDFYFTVPNLD